MTLDGLIVAAVVGAALAYLAWHFRPRKGPRMPLACGGCAHKDRHAELLKRRPTP